MSTEFSQKINETHTYTHKNKHTHTHTHTHTQKDMKNCQKFLDKRLLL